MQPGIVNDTLRDAANQYTLTFGPDPATHNRCTIGGNIGNNSCGIHSVMAGKTSENVEELEILTYEGHQMRVGATPEAELEEVVRGGGPRGEIYGRLRSLRDRYAERIREGYPKIPRRVSGYNLDKLLPEAGFNVAQALVGTESTCAMVLRARCRLVYNPPERTLVVLGYKDVYDAADHIMEVLAYKPIGLEGLDDEFIEDMKIKGLHPRDLALMPEGGGWLLVEFGGHTAEESRDKAHRLIEDLERQPGAPHIKLFDDKAHERLVWELRESGLGATAHVPGQKENWEGWEDSAVPPRFVSRYLKDLHKLFGKYGYRGALYGHFGDGCVHTRIDFDLKTAEGIRHFRSFLSDAVDTVLSYGGSLSGEHGDGQSRAEFLPRMFGKELMEAQREFKRIWDPRWKMNPGKVMDPMPVDSNLRYGVRYDPPNPATHFHYADDHHSFARAMERCVGVGECRRLGGRHHVPELHGYARREAFDARPRAGAVRDARRRSARGRLEERVRQGCAGPVPFLQGLQGRLPRQRGHGHLQGGVPLALLQGPHPAAERLRFGPDPLVGARGFARAGAGQPVHAGAGAERRGQVRGRILAEAAHAAVRLRDLSRLVQKAARRSTKASGK